MIIQNVTQRGKKQESFSGTERREVRKKIGKERKRLDDGLSGCLRVESGWGVEMPRWSWG